MNLTLKTLAAAAALIAAGAQAQSWSRYDYTATVNSNTVVDGTSFAAGSQVTGEVFVLNGVAPGNGGWGFAGEVAVYGDAVTLFTFHHATLDTAAAGAGNAQVDNNRRLTKRGDGWQDVFMASIGVEPTSQFMPTSLGGGVNGLSFSLRSTFQGNPQATTSLALPSLVNVPLFNDMTQNYLRLSFSNGMFVDSTIQSMTMTTVTAVPEPGSFALAGLGLAGLALARRRQSRR